MWFWLDLSLREGFPLVGQRLGHARSAMKDNQSHTPVDNCGETMRSCLGGNTVSSRMPPSPPLIRTGVECYSTAAGRGEEPWKLFGFIKGWWFMNHSWWWRASVEDSPSLQRCPRAAKGTPLLPLPLPNNSSVQTRSWSTLPDWPNRFFVKLHTRLKYLISSIICFKKLVDYHLSKKRVK